MDDIKPVGKVMKSDEGHLRVAWSVIPEIDMPVYPESALAQAREEGRREGMLEAAEICRHRSVKCSSFGAAYHALSCDGDAEAITRAAEGK